MVDGRHGAIGVHRAGSDVKLFGVKLSGADGFGVNRGGDHRLGVGGAGGGCFGGFGAEPFQRRVSGLGLVGGAEFGKSVVKLEFASAAALGDQMLFEAFDRILWRAIANDQDPCQAVLGD